jgi:hypothetical protein
MYEDGSDLGLGSLDQSRVTDEDIPGVGWMRLDRDLVAVDRSFSGCPPS